MNTILTIKYKTRNYRTIKTETILISDSIFKQFIGYFEYSEKMKERFKYCDLFATGNEQCQLFLKEIIEIIKNEFLIEYEENCSLIIDKINKCEVLEIKFGLKNIEE